MKRQRTLDHALPQPRRGIPRLVLPMLLATLSLAACEGESPAHPVAPAPVQQQAADGPLGLDIAAQELRDGSGRLGVNLPPVFSYSRTPMFVDLMHQARRFGTPATPWDEKALLGPDGWPTGDFGIFLLSSQGGVSGIGGTYTLRFRGQAKVAVVASPASLGQPRYDPGTGITTIRLTLPPHTDQLALAFTETRGSVKGLRLIRPGYDAGNPPLFTREFLEHIAPYKVVRLMDWMRTNNNPVNHWTQRPTPENTHYASDKGTPVEYLIELARIADKDLWINIPGRADDEYVRTLAKLLHDRLPEKTRLYVEYSNEVWNGQFRQSGDNRADAAQEVERNPYSRLDHDGSGDRNKWAFRRIAQRGKEISDLFRAEFGDAAMMTRIRPIYATQVVNTYLTAIGLDYLSTIHGPPSRYFYGLAGAPYFNLGPQQKTEGLSTDEVLAAMSVSIDAVPQVNQFEQNLALASWHRLPFLAYEGGSDTFGPGSLYAKRAASLDPRMEPLCRRYLDNWYASGGGLFMWFTAGAGNWDTQYGTWELTTDLALADTPKIRCLQGMLNEPQVAPRSRNTVPGRIDALAYVGNFPPYTDQSRDKVRYLHPGSHVDYLVLAKAAGAYQLSLNASGGRVGNRVEVATAADQVAGALELPKTGWDQVGDTATLTIQLREGFNTLRLTTRAETSGFHLRHLDVRLATAGGAR